MISSAAPLGLAARITSIRGRVVSLRARYGHFAGLGALDRLLSETDGDRFGRAAWKQMARPQFDHFVAFGQRAGDILGAGRDHRGRVGLRACGNQGRQPAHGNARRDQAAVA